jgi:hypothetical protein
MSADCSCLVNDLWQAGTRCGHYAARMPGPPAGLCDSCRHQQVVRTKRSSFSLCRRWKEDDRYPRYPRLPVLRCRGHERRTDGEAGDRHEATAP